MNYLMAIQMIASFEQYQSNTEITLLSYIDHGKI
jgi:hypothetical protein